MLLTFAGDAPGREISRHTPDASSLTLREHFSFVELPDANYQPRAFDPRIGSFSLTFTDFSRPFTVKPEGRWIQRWRLEKKDPSAALSDPVKPIIYYLDPGIPEPVSHRVPPGIGVVDEGVRGARLSQRLSRRDA